MALKIIGHRGAGRTDNNPFAAALPPQHTLLSFQQAIDGGADGIEFDIFLSKDDVPVIIDRKSAEALPIGNFTAAEIARLPVPAGQHIPTLEELLIFVAQTQARLPHKKLLINAELKGPGTAGPAVRVMDDVGRRYPLDRSRIFFDALEWDRLSDLRRLDPSANIMPALSTARLFNLAGHKAGTPLAYDPAVFKALEDFIRDERCCGIDVMTDDIRPEMIALAERLDVTICSYPQGPKPKSAAESIHRNMGMLEEFSRRSRHDIILKVEDVAATRALVEDYRRGLPPSPEKIEKMMGLKLT